MCAYAVFTVAGLAALVRGVGWLAMPVLFFVAYGTLGNAVAHTTWVLATGGYFPGFVTGLVHLALGLLLLARILGGWSTALRWCVPYVVVLVLLLVLALER